MWIESARPETSTKKYQNASLDLDQMFPTINYIVEGGLVDQMNTLTKSR